MSPIGLQTSARLGGAGTSHAAHRAVFIAAVALFQLAMPGMARSAEVDLHNACIVAPRALSRQEEKALTLFVEEIEKRTRIRLEVCRTWPASSVPVIAIGPAGSWKEFAGPFADHPPDLPAQPSSVSRVAKERSSSEGGAEGYRLFVQRKAGRAPAVFVVGNDARGILFGLGQLLREMHLARDRVTLGDNVRLASAPRYPLRGHQLGYRPKTNSYDGWNVALWEQYILYLAVFGTIVVVLIPPRSDDDAHSPHFPLAPMDMVVAISRLL